ncbi:MAG: aldo/keto reductase [Verrucomicrobiota bacterium]|nr:aldo/keto reductase [Verrucomicrobiota bacterium]HBV32899.1 aldo/keto reductase [Verrucomicrobiales bacterium]
MRFRKIRKTDLEVSEVGFGLWTVSTGWWGKFTDEDAVGLIQKGFDRGINLYDAADTYGNGRSEELLAKALGDKRDDVVIATKVGYDFYNHDGDRKGQREIEQDFSKAYIKFATEKCLERLKTDRIDIMQLHNVRAAQVDTDEVWEALEELEQEGKLVCSGIALGPAIGWMYEGVDCVQRRNPRIIQHIYNMLEQFPGNQINASTYAKSGKDNATTEDLADFRHGRMTEEPELDTSFLIRVTHSSGMLEGKYTEDTVFPPEDHRSHRPRSWLVNGLKKIKTLEFLTSPESGRTLGQAALLWLLAEKTVASTLPNIYNEEQLIEFTEDKPYLSEDELQRVEELFSENFGVEEDPCNFKGTMERETAA